MTPVLAFTIFFMCLSVLLSGGILAITPRLMPSTECFAVTVPPSAQQDPRIRIFRRNYTLAVIAASVACAGGLALVLARLLVQDPSSEQSAVASSAAIAAATLVPLALGFALMLFYRSRVQALKQVEGWTATSQGAAALVGEDLPKPISFAWNLLHVAMTLALTALGLAFYDHFPDQIPMNVDFSGTVAQYAPKSLGSVLFPAITVGYMGLMFALCHWYIIVSKRPLDPVAPSTSALAYARFARVQSQLLLVGGLLISAGIGAAFYLSALEVVSLSVAAIVLLAVVVAFVIGVAIISIRFGQSGARLAAELRPSDAIGADDDGHWYLGTFYFNPDDASIMVPKRFGIGWTINCARPAAWLSIALVVLITAAFVLLMNMTVG